MFETFDKVKQNEFINNLNDSAEKFGIYSCYVKYNGSTDKTVNSIYFVAGTSKKSVEPNLKKIESLLTKVELDSEFLHIDCMPFELTDNPAFATHQNVIEFCRQAEFVREVYKDHGLKAPEKIDKRFLVHLMNLYKEKEKNGKESFYNTLYENAFDKYIKLEDKLTSRDYETKRKAELELYGLIEKNTLTSVFKKKLDSGLYDNFCTLEDLSTQEGVLAKHKTKAKYLEPLSKELAKNPDILCWHSKIEKQPTAIINQEMGIFKSKEKDDDSVVCLRYNILNSDRITRMLATIAYPDIANRDISRIVNGSPINIAIRELDLELFKRLCDKNDVNFGFDPDRIYHTGTSGPFSIIADKDDADKLEEILRYMAKRSEMCHTHNLGIPSYNPNDKFTIANLDDFGGFDR